MPHSMPISMAGQTLPAEFSIGPLQFTNADQVALDELWCNVKDHEITLRMNAEHDSSSPWRGLSMVVFFMYQFPDRQEEFQETVIRYRKDAKIKIKLPEKVPFDETSLALADVPDGWEHNCFAAANRNLFHVYTSDSMAVMIRWYAKKGTMLDHPFLSLVQQNVRLVNDQWIAEEPQTVQTEVVDVDDSEEPEVDLRIDLRTERAAIKKYIEDRLNSFDPETNYGPGDGKTISAMDLGFEFSQGGWVALIFDTREDAEPDGQWTTFLDEENMFYSDANWPALAEAMFEEEEVEVTFLDGTVKAMSGDWEELIVAIGEMLKELLLEAKSSGLLANLPTSKKCYLGVEDFEGNYGWPEYEQRDAEGLL